MPSALLLALLMPGVGSRTSLARRWLVVHPVPLLSVVWMALHRLNFHYTLSVFAPLDYKDVDTAGELHFLRRLEPPL
jgi:hypothetical protein